MRRIWLSCLLAPAILAAPAGAQTGMELPRDYALTHVRIVVAPGRVVEDGVVLVRDGRITAAGPTVAVPAGVVALDLSGMTVYPGLIDVANAIGLPRITAQGRGGGGGAAAPAPANEPPPELNPGRAAADAFQIADTELDAFRAAGITTVGLAFDGGIFPGRVSAVDLTDGPAAAMVLRTPIAQQVALGRRRGGYPSTAMGTFAYIQQSFLDAQWEQRAAAAFESHPATAKRPDYDPEHRALQPAASGEMPVWFAVSTERDVRRIIGLANEIGVSDYVLVGVQEGYRTVEAIVATGRPVIATLNYPAVDRVTGRAFELHVAPASGTDQAKADADSVVARDLRGNVAALAAAGITVALSGQGLSGPDQFRDRILGVVEAGFSPEDALRALTVTPARLLGLEAALGTIETGKLANLVVVDGDLFAREGKIRHVFVEGRKYDIPEPAVRGEGGRGGQGGAGGGADAAQAAGEWVGEMEGPSGMMNFTLTIRADGTALSGQFATEMGPVDLTGEQNGAGITLRGMAAPPGMNSFEVTITGTVSATDLRGTLDAAGMATVPFNARRRGPGSAAPADFAGQQPMGGGS